MLIRDQRIVNQKFQILNKFDHILDTLFHFSSLTTSDSAVATPAIGNDPELEKEWLLAKGIVDGIDMAVCQSKWHLLDSHVTEAMFCIVFRRHLSSRHPLYELIESHCEGTVPVTAIGVPSLIKEFSFAHKLFPIGDKGARKLINTYYQKQHYDDSDFELLLKVRLKCTFLTAYCKKMKFSVKGVLSGLRQFLPTEDSLKMMKNAFYFTSKALFILKIFKFLS